MTLKHRMRILGRRLGLDVHRFNHCECPEARLFWLLNAQKIDLVLDVSANDGGYAKSLRENGYNGKILSFEPLDIAWAKLSTAAASDPGWAVYEKSALGAKKRDDKYQCGGQFDEQFNIANA